MSIWSARSKRPTPGDFFRSIEDGSGIDLDWFWRGWFYGTEHVDVAISEVSLYQIDSRDPEEEKPWQRAQDKEVEPSLSDQHNKGSNTLMDRNPKLKDFYTEFDEFDVTPYDSAQFEKYLKSLEAQLYAQIGQGGMGKTCSVIGILGWLLLAPLAHPAHSSYTEIDWNQAGDTLEVSMRIIPEELEAALSWRSETGKAVVLEDEALSAPLLEAYLAESFQIRNAASELMPIRLVGMDISYAETWLYFTVTASSRDRLSLRNTVLQELESQQINRVRRLWRGSGDSQSHRQNGPEQPLWDGD